MRQRRRDIHIKGAFFACYSFSAMGAAIAETTFGSDYRLLHGCVATSLLLHVLVVVYVPRVVPHQEPPPRLTATIRPAEPPPVVLPQDRAALPQVAAQPVTQDAAKPQAPPKPAPRSQAEPTKPIEPVRSDPPAPAPQTTLVPTPAPPSVAAPAAPVAVPAAPVTAPSPVSASSAPVEAKAETRTERPAAPAAPVPPAQTSDASDRDLVVQYQAQIGRFIERNNLVRYPEEAKQNGWIGAATVLLKIGSDGKVAGLETAASAGHDMLDEQARIAILKAKPSVQIPEGLKGKPFEIRVRITFRQAN